MPGLSGPADGGAGETPQLVASVPELEALLTAVVSSASSPLQPTKRVLGDDLSAYTLSQIRRDCSLTTLRGRGARALFSRFEIPPYTALLDDIRDTSTVFTDPKGIAYRVLTTWTIACEDRAARVLLLSPTPAGTSVLRPYEADVRFLCAKFLDPEPGESRWHCSEGTLGVGVFASTSPPGRADSVRRRTAFVRSVELHGNRFSYHFAHLAGTGSISNRVEPPTGFSTPQGWDLNPNDHYPDGGSKARDYLAAVAVKTTTQTDGAQVSPYTRNRLDGRVDPGLLNDCEEDESGAYLLHPDLASNGTIEGVNVHIVASQEVYDRCPTLREIGVKPVATRSRTGPDGGSLCRYFEVGVGTSLRVGLNTHDVRFDRQRCLQALDGGSRGAPQEPRPERKGQPPVR